MVSECIHKTCIWDSIIFLQASMPMLYNKSFLNVYATMPISSDFRAAPGEVSGTECKVKGLVEGKDYEFRVAAVNEAGPGEFVEGDQAFSPAPPPSK